MVELDVSLAHEAERQSSILEEDLAISSSANNSSQVEVPTTNTMPPDSSVTYPTRSPSIDSIPCKEQIQQPVIYLSENAMDCNYDESSDQSKCETITKKVEEENPASPDLFESDAEDDIGSNASSFQNVLSSQQQSLPSPEKLSTPEKIAKADKWLLKRINKFLSGVPPPPSFTISQKDCGDFIIEMYKNRQYFWADPFELDKYFKPVNLEANSLGQKLNQENFEALANSTLTNEATNKSTKKGTHQTKAGLRNLSSAFDECEQASNSKDSSTVVDTALSDTTSSVTLSDTIFNSSFFSSSSSVVQNEDSKFLDNEGKPPPTLFQSIKTSEAIDLDWPAVSKHKCHDIYYNRNKAVETFESLRMKLCDTYIGAETQSTCSTWFAKQMPGSARKRSLLARRNNMQSPGKRLSYLARRRRTFSSANVQCLGLAKEKFMLNMSRVPVRKGKSPRGKSPRIKSPRKRTPRSSAKKRLLLRRLQLDGPSPRKIKIETSKRALFQSPPNERPGPSRPVGSSTVTNNNAQKLKRALFLTPKKSEANGSSLTPDSKKRKSDEDLEQSRKKWPKSLSFDCARNVDTSSVGSQLVRHSTSSLISREPSASQGKSELSDAHRKKLLWAVARVLRERGIEMKHPMFKKYSAILGRYVRRNMPDLVNKNIPRKNESTSDRMYNLAKRHALLIIDSQNT